MNPTTHSRSPIGGPATAAVLLMLLGAGPGLLPTEVRAQADERPGEVEQWWDASDPRIGLGAGWMDAESASWNMELLSNTPRPEPFYDPENVGDLGFANSDLAFRGDVAFVGNFYGFQIFDISDPGDPDLRTAVVCPGGQGDLSVFGDLLFMSVEEVRGRVDCGTEGTSGEADPERFRGVRIFDISDLDDPQQVAAVQTCRGSHTHSLLYPAAEPDHLYVYVSGTAGVRPEEELAECAAGPGVDPEESALFRIEVIRVPLAAPERAEVVSAPRVFADPETGDVAGLWEGGPHGEGTQRTRPTDHCHDITTYPAQALAAGACSGNGILLDVSDAVDPVRIDEVVDPNFAYWHSATFDNEAATVIFTDEWGGGTQARCRETDPPLWGANAIFRLHDGRMEHRSYYKLPVPQGETQNCVAHNGSIVPVPGRDIMVQAWYQGGISVFDFTAPSAPYEIAFFDRGPLDAEQLQTGGHWSAYWYNGRIYASEIARGLDVLELVPSEHLSRNELEAARLVQLERFNAQHQSPFDWPAEIVVARALHDQVLRHEALPPGRAEEVGRELERIEAIDDPAEQRSALVELAIELRRDLRRIQSGEQPGDTERVERLLGAVMDVAAEPG